MTRDNSFLPFFLSLFNLTKVSLVFSTDDPVEQSQVSTEQQMLLLQCRKERLHNKLTVRHIRRKKLRMSILVIHKHYGQAR